MEIDALKSLLAFVDTGSITRAAQQVNRTQSAISMQMKKLESDLDKVLFEKHGRNLILTKDGHALVGYAKQLVAHYDNTLCQIKNSGLAERIRLACPDDYATTILPKVVAKMHQIWPNLDLHIRCLPSNIIRQQLDNNELDIAIVTRSFDSEEGLVICKDAGVWVSNGDSEIVNKETLPIVTFQQDCRFHHAAIEGLHKQQTPFKIIAQSASVSAMYGLVKAGLAIGVMARSSKADLVEISSQTMPPLPEISIVLLVNSNSQRVISQQHLTALTRIDE